jgi:hypothetical protein
MPLSAEQASEALNQIADAQARSATLYGYWRGAPHLILWGALWMIGFGLTYVFSKYATVIWSIVTPLGIAAGIAVERCHSHGIGVRHWRYLAIALTFAVFFFSAFAIMPPRSGDQTAAFISLVVALIYVLMGLWIGARYAVAGILLAAFTLAGSFLLRDHFTLWMAAVGGGGLVFAGLWLRKP